VGPQNTATIYGGRQLTGSTQACTSGFTVTSDVGPGIITAGHCDPTGHLEEPMDFGAMRANADAAGWKPPDGPPRVAVLR